MLTPFLAQALEYKGQGPVKLYYEQGGCVVSGGGEFRQVCLVFLSSAPLFSPSYVAKAALVPALSCLCLVPASHRIWENQQASPAIQQAGLYIRYELLRNPDDVFRSGGDGF